MSYIVDVDSLELRRHDPILILSLYNQALEIKIITNTINYQIV